MQGYFKRTEKCKPNGQLHEKTEDISKESDYHMDGLSSDGLKLEGYDTKDDIVRLPKDLKARHDELVELRNQRANKERLKGYTKLDQQIQERLPEVQKYFWEDKTYMIIPAGNCED